MVEGHPVPSVARTHLSACYTVQTHSERLDQGTVGERQSAGQLDGDSLRDGDKLPKTSVNAAQAGAKVGPTGQTRAQSTTDIRQSGDPITDFQTRHLRARSYYFAGKLVADDGIGRIDLAAAAVRHAQVSAADSTAPHLDHHFVRGGHRIGACSMASGRPTRL